MNRTSQKGFTVLQLLLTWVIIGIPVLTGWILNIIEIVNIINEPMTNLLIFRFVGIIVFPLGAVLGFV